MDAIKDLCTITSIPYSNLKKLCNKLEDIICHNIKESHYDCEEVTTTDIGIGQIIIYVNDENIQYKFIPSSSFEAKIISTVTNNSDVMVTHIEEALKDRIINSYKDLF